MDEIEKLVNKILKGIDETETEATEGWWETSTGAEFGAKKKLELLKALRHLTSRRSRAAGACVL